MRTARLRAAIVVGIAAMAIVAAQAFAQFIGPALPLTTTLVIEKPGPDQNVDRRHAIDIGVKNHDYTFVLHDAFVDDPKWVWSDVWQSVNQFRPNFQVQGPGGDKIAAIRPNEIVTVKGMCFIRTRTLEVITVEPGGPFAPKRSY